MKILFLGTSSAEGYPGLFCECKSCEKARKLKGKNIRTRSSILIDRIYKVDLPPDTYLHTIKYGLNLAEIEHLFITHSHIDHFAVSELACRSEEFAYFKKERILNIYGNKKVCKLTENFFKKRTKYKTYINLHIIEPFKKFKVGDMDVYPIQADHDPNEKCLNFIFNYRNRTILQGYDTGWYSDKTWEYLKNFRFDLVIMDCSGGKHPQMKNHLGMVEVIKVKNKLLQNNLLKDGFKFIVTHLSHFGSLLHSELTRGLKKEGIEVAYDGKIVKL
ncbi:MAG TPA: MBL fold metallo-hydrolase [Candidatus Ratteibacteria bacterium]|nr:MBL fold metallo-hydrolase [Candidatus Ratteibacteria bacterium]